MASKRHGASRKYKSHHHHHYHHLHHHHNKHYHHFNQPTYVENESDKNVESTAGSFKQIHQSGVQNSLDFQNVGYEDSEISSKADQVLRSWDGEPLAVSQSVTNMNEEKNELGNIASNEQVDNAAASNVPYDILAQTQSDNPTLPLQYSLKNNALYDTKYTDDTPNHIQRWYHRMSAKQKSKQFFADVSQAVATARSSPESTRVISQGREHGSRLGVDVLHGDVVAEDGIPHANYHDNDQILSADKSTVSYNTHNKLIDSVYEEIHNKETQNQTGSLQNSDGNTTKLLGYQHDRTSILYRHSPYLQPIDGRPFRSLIESISLSEPEEIGLHWPVKKEAVVEGDLVLGGLMMVHEREDTHTCGPIMPQGGIQALETMLFTLDSLNRDPKMIPNVSIGAHILDDCDKDTYGLEMAVDFIKGRERQKASSHVKYFRVFSVLCLTLRYQFVC
jgi:hypothetical protein